MPSAKLVTTSLTTSTGLAVSVIEPSVSANSWPFSSLNKITVSGSAAPSSGNSAANVKGTMGVVAEAEKYSAKLAPMFSNVPTRMPLRNTKNSPSSASVAPSVSPRLRVMSSVVSEMMPSSASAVPVSSSLTLTERTPSVFSNAMVFVALLSLSAVAGAVSKVMVSLEKSVSFSAKRMER